MSFSLGKGFDFNKSFQIKDPFSKISNAFTSSSGVLGKLNSIGDSLTLGGLGKYQSLVGGALSEAFQKAGLSEGTSNALGGFTGGGYLGAARILGDAKAQKEARAIADSNEGLRQNFNNQVLGLGQAVGGSLASDPFTNFDEKLKFQGDATEEQKSGLEALLKVFKARQGEVQQSNFTPALSQTRLSMVQ